MYEEEMFDKDGWLWTRGTPNGEWHKASAERTIARLHELLREEKKSFRDFVKEVGGYLS